MLGPLQMVILCIAVVLGLLRLVPELKVAGLKYSRPQVFKRHLLGMLVHPKGQLTY
jgi:hypothetical protein